MEDYFSMTFEKNKDGGDHVYACFGAYDGHWGKEAIEYAKDNLINTITKSPKFGAGHDSQVVTAIREGFRIEQEVMYKESRRQWPPKEPGLQSIAGSTASICFAMQMLANVSGITGQHYSRITKWQAKWLTKDHRPDNEVELAQMRAAGEKRRQVFAQSVAKRTNCGDSEIARRAAKM